MLVVISKCLSLKLLIICLFFFTAIPVESVAQNPLVSMVLTSYGGHIGFLEGTRIDKSNYMERLFVEFARGIFNLVGKDKLQEMVEEAHS